MGKKVCLGNTVVSFCNDLVKRFELTEKASVLEWEISDLRERLLPEMERRVVDSKARNINIVRVKALTNRKRELSRKEKNFLSLKKLLKRQELGA